MLATQCCYHGANKGLVYFTLAYFTLTVTLSVHGNSNTTASKIIGILGGMIYVDDVFSKKGANLSPMHHSMCNHFNVNKFKE